MTIFSDYLGRLFAVVFLLVLPMGCAEIVSASPEEVRVDSGDIGEIVPRTRQWFSRQEANKHCSKFGKKSKLVDLKGPEAVYRCVPAE